MPTNMERAWVAFVPRGIVGLMYLFAGADKVFQQGAASYAQRVGELSHMREYFPVQAIYPAAFVTGYLELLFGAMLIIGIKTRWAARALGAMIVMVGAGYGLAGLIDPVGGVTAMDIRAINTYILPRAALLILVLMLPEEDDLFTAERLVAR
jgi:uncharacterized membrane protein YphA (DoxX/SURF4 family)